MLPELDGLDKTYMKIDSFKANFWDTDVRSLASRRGFVNAEALSVEEEAPRIFALISSDASLHAVVKISKEAMGGRIERPIVGIELSERLLEIQGLGKQKVLDIRCCSGKYKEMFTWLVSDIAVRLSQIEDAHSAVSEALSLGKRFWQQISNQVADKRQQLGLWGELKCVREFLEKEKYFILDVWEGPARENYDFCMGKSLIEVKSTLKPRHQHEIANLKQLEVPSGAVLYLWSNRAVEDKSGTSVWDEVIAISRRISNDPERTQAFFDKVAAAGFHPDHAAAYSENKFSLADSKVFKVGASFPKITADSFKKPLPREVLSVKYSIDLESQKSESCEKLVCRLK